MPPASARVPVRARERWRAMALLAALGVLLNARQVWGDILQRKLSPYEQETVAIVLSESGGTLDPAPSGKRVEAVEVVTLDVLEPRDPAPLFLNWVHVTTEAGIIEREVLLTVGEAYDPALAAETERNLRSFSQFSVVLLVPVRGSRPDTVRVIVITKDVWSLRLNWQPSFVNGKLTSLSLAPAESNLFGTTQTVLGSVYLDPINYWIGGRYFVPRIAGSRIRANIGGNAIFNCRTDELEGATGDFTYGQPLYSSLTKWSWQTSAAWSSSLVRGLATRQDQSICGGAPTAAVRYRVSEADVTGQEGSRVVEQDELVFPSLYRAERLRGQVVLTRSFNVQNKLNLSTGLEVDARSTVRDPVRIEDTVRQRVRYDEQPSGDYVRTILDELPPNTAQFDAASRVYLDPGSLRARDRRISPYAQLHGFSNSYIRLINYDTLGLQEDVQVGHDLYLRLYPALQPLSTRDLMGLFASAAYTTPFRGGFARVLASSSIEYAGVRRSDVGVRAAAHVATRDVGVGRFVYDIGFTHQPVQYLSGVYVLGGSGRLRGYSPSRLLGPGLATFNHEFRSRPLRLFSVLTGLAVFHDVGSVFFDDLAGFRLRQGAGAGIRILAPQLDRDVFRIDFAFPLVFPRRDDPAAEFTFVASFGQAFSLPGAPPPVLLPQ